MPTLDAVVPEPLADATRDVSLRLLVEELGNGAGELIQVDQEGVVAVR